jgi:hypothetical protein
MQIKIISSETKTSSKGNAYKKVSLNDGRDLNNVAVFPSFSQYEKVTAGSVVEGVVKEKEYNGSKSYSLEDGNLGKKPSGVGNMSKLMEKKAENIREAQERKEDSIAFFNATNSAVSIVLGLIEIKSKQKGSLGEDVSEYPDPAIIRKSIVDYRNWFLREYDDFKNPPEDQLSF